MMLSDCCDSIPYNDIIHEAYGEHYGMCAECREHCGFHDDSEDEEDDDVVSPNAPGDEHIERVYEKGYTKDNTNLIQQRVDRDDHSIGEGIDKDVHDHPLGVGFAHKDTKA